METKAKKFLTILVWLLLTFTQFIFANTYSYETNVVSNTKPYYKGKLPWNVHWTLKINISSTIFCQEMEQFRVEFVNGISTVATCMPLKILGHFDYNIKKEIFEEI